MLNNDYQNFYQNLTCFPSEESDIKSIINNLFLLDMDNPYEIPLDYPPIPQEENKEKKFNIKRYNIPGRKVTVKKKVNFHDKNTSDNIFRTLVVHYMNFILDYVNEILKKFGFRVKFYDIDYKDKSNISPKRINFLKSSNIGEILCTKISAKYRKLIKSNDKLNETIFKEVTKNNIIKNILSEEYLYLFKEVYFKNKREINLTRYGYNCIINLPEKIETFGNLLHKKNMGSNCIYEMKLRNIIAKYFNLIFFSD